MYSCNSPIKDLLVSFISSPKSLTYGFLVVIILLGIARSECMDTKEHSHVSQERNTLSSLCFDKLLLLRHFELPSDIEWNIVPVIFLVTLENLKEEYACDSKPSIKIGEEEALEINKSAHFSPNSKTILTCPHHSGMMCLWNVVTGKKLRSYPHPENVISSQFSSKGETFITTSDERARVWNTATGEIEHTVCHPLTKWGVPIWLTTAAVNSSSTKIVTGDRESLRILNSSTKELLKEFPIGGMTPQNAVFSADEKALLVRIHGKNALLLFLEENDSCMIKCNNLIVPEAFSFGTASGRTLMLIGTPKEVFVYAVTSKELFSPDKPLFTYENKTGSGPYISAAVLSSDNQTVFIAFGGTKGVQIWNIAEKKCVVDCPDSRCFVPAVLSSDDSMFLGISDDLIPTLWNSENGQKLQELNAFAGHSPIIGLLALSPDNTIALVQINDNKANQDEPDSDKTSVIYLYSLVPQEVKDFIRATIATLLDALHNKTQVPGAIVPQLGLLSKIVQAKKSNQKLIIGPESSECAILNSMPDVVQAYLKRNIKLI